MNNIENIAIEIDMNTLNDILTELSRYDDDFISHSTRTIITHVRERIGYISRTLILRGGGVYGRFSEIENRIFEEIGNIELRISEYHGF